MKAKINGIELEGSADDIVSIIKKLDRKDSTVAEEQPVDEKPVFYVRASRHKRRVRPSDEYKALLDKAAHICMTKGISSFSDIKPIVKEVLGRYGSKREVRVVYAKIYRYNRKLNKGLEQPVGEAASSPSSPSVPDFKEQRRKFISARVKTIIAENPSLSYTNAYYKARQEWDLHGRKLRVPVEGFGSPKMPIVLDNPELNKLLIDMLRNVAKKNGKIVLPVEGQMLGINNVVDWDIFLVRVFTKISDISAFLGVPNNFELVRSDVRRGNHYIGYGGW